MDSAFVPSLLVSILAIIAAVVCGVAWWLSLDRLSAEERLLVGMWNFGPKVARGGLRWQFWPDRWSTYGLIQPSGAVTMTEQDGRWLVREGALFVDGEPSAFRRAFRPILRGIGLPVNSVLTYGLESISAGELVLVMSDGTRETWTRAPAD